MTAKKTVYLGLSLFMLVSLSSCGRQPNASDSQHKEDTETYQTLDEADDTEDTGDDLCQIPAEAEIQAVLDNGEVKVFWAIEENVFSQPAAVSIYETETVDGDAVWDALFSQYELTSRQQLDGYSKMSITLDGAEYAGQLYNTGMIEFSNLPEFPAALSPENLMGALSDFTGMDWTLGKSDDVSDTSTYYQFSVDEIIIDRKGYSVGEDSYTGPHAVFDSSYMAISVPFRLGASKDTVSSSDFISSEQAKTLCNADLLAQVDFPMVVVFDHAELVYYYQAQQQMLIPAWRLTGTSYQTDGGTLHPSITTRLIDAQTGELFW